MKHAGNILIASLGRQPENTLLHWAGEMLKSSQVSKTPWKALSFEDFEVRPANDLPGYTVCGNSLEAL